MDHDQFFKRLMHLFLREFFELFFEAWLDRFDFARVEWLEQEVFPDPPRGEKRVVDLLAKIATVPGDPPREHEPQGSMLLIHIEVESSDSLRDFRERMYEYHHDVRKKYKMDVLPIGIFLSVGLDGRGRDSYECRTWEETTLLFNYNYVGLPALSGEDYLHGKNMLGVAWSCVMHLARNRRVTAAAEAYAIIEASSLSPEQKMALMDFMHAYSPMDASQQRDLNELLKDPKLERAMTFRKTWSEEARDEARTVGRQEGRQQEKLNLIQRLVRARFPSVAEEIVYHRLANLSVERLDEIFNRAISANSLEELGLED